MPYIKKQDRVRFAEIISILTSLDSRPGTCGELNFLITKLCHFYMDKKGESYQIMNDIVGALECAKLEFYRRDITNYEERKIKENGDIHGE